MGLLLSEGSPLSSGYISGHNVFTLLSGSHYFGKFTVILTLLSKSSPFTNFRIIGVRSNKVKLMDELRYLFSRCFLRGRKTETII